MILRIMDQNEENELLRITQNTDTFSCEVMGNLYFLMKNRPDTLKSHPQMTAMIKRRYSEIVDYPLPSTLCLNPAGAPILSVPLDNIEGYLYTELRKGHLDGWKAQEKATYLAAKIQSGIEKTTRILHHANISASTQQNAFLETMAMCGLKQLEIPPPHTHIPIEKMVKEVLLADKTFQAFLVTDPSTSQSMLAEIIETLSDQVFHAIFRIDPQAIQKMAEEQLTTLHVRSEQQSGCLCCFLYNQTTLSQTSRSGFTHVLHVCLQSNLLPGAIMPHMTGSDENSHLNGLFFPLVWQFVVKFAASSGSLLLPGC